PAYQQGAQGFAAGVPPGTGRFVPDVAALASRPFALIVVEGNFTLGGGTSLSSPLWAGMMALINQFKGSPQGSPNAALYRLGVNQFKNGGPAAFADITLGDNSVAPVPPCLPSGWPGFSAKTGYDPVTGWGVPNINVIANNFSATPASSDTVGVYS